MPYAALKPCAYPRCAARVPPGTVYCAAHTTVDIENRPSSNARGYTWQWAQRAELFKQRYPLCGMRPGGVPPLWSLCYERGLLVPAYQVDHVIPHRGDPVLFWDEDHNWQSLCAACGARKSAAGL